MTSSKTFFFSVTMVPVLLETSLIPSTRVSVFLTSPATAVSRPPATSSITLP
uniref:Uncharacterized protein n=1 Tax=Amphimedon queenslandica TaxID=400682 RepID=A0A1X7UWM9_AMPQE